MIHNKRIEEIKKRISKIRSKPWKSYIEGRDHQSGSNFIMVGEGDDREEDIYINGITEAEQDFIANARQDIQYLLKELEDILKNRKN